MVGHWSDPEGQREIHKARYDAAVDQFHTNKIGEATFRVTLLNLGFKDYEIDAEVALHRPEHGINAKRG